MLALVNVCKTTGSAVILASSKQEYLSDVLLCSGLWLNWLFLVKNTFCILTVSLGIGCPVTNIIQHSSWITLSQSAGFLLWSDFLFSSPLYHHMQSSHWKNSFNVFSSQLILFRSHLKHHWQQSYKVRKRSSLCRFWSFLELNQHLPIWIAWGSILPIPLIEAIPSVTSI